ncbi:RhoGAP [Fasciola hepatica]|uniref:RhoGAP n=1 Tax=Fasciola hepatica TaxID=6192 RepID=A0A4E0R5Y1_FASHE|nr:RhoGAP [Fasciola hepatica]
MMAKSRRSHTISGHTPLRHGSVKQQSRVSGSNNALVTGFMSTTASDPSKETAVSKSSVPVIKEFEIEFGHGVSEEDKLLSRKDKNAIDFAFNYSKLWCKSCKDLVLGLEKRAYAENEACRAIVKHFQAFETNLNSLVGAPMKTQRLSLARMLIDHCKETETHNTKRCRELLEVLTRQRTLFEKTRKFLKDKWKSDVKRMLDAENSLIKTKSAYYQRCQTGVKLREELAMAQNQLNEMNAGMPVVTGSGPGIPSGSISPGPTSPGQGQSAPITNSPMGANQGQTVGSTASLTQDIADSAPDSAATSTSSTSNQVAKQRAKVERLEKQLSDNDKKEIEQMYAYREAVEQANHRLCELEKSKMEILCDTRLTIRKSDEVVKDSLAELFNHLYTTRINMVKQYETIAAAFQDYVPCSEYRALIEEHIQKGVDTYPEKYQFAGFHEASSSGGKLDSLTGRFSGRSIGSARDASDNDPLAGTRSALCIHSDSDSEGEDEPGPSKSGGLVSTSSNVLSSLVEFGSNLFRPDSKKSVRGKRGQGSAGSTNQAVMSGSATTESLDTLTAQLANLEKEYVAACYPIARCVAAIEKQPGGLETHGIYRVPASKAKVASLLESIQSSQPMTPEKASDDIAMLSQEHPLTLAGLIKTRLIALPEPLLTYNLYPNFVELGKIFDASDANILKELVKRLQLLINHLSPGNKRLAGLLFHHLYRVAACQSENQMSSANLGTMFGPTVLRQKPKFQVANMMEFMDNKGQTRVVEVLIDQVVEIFGPAEHYDPVYILTSPPPTVDDEIGLRRSSGPLTRRNTATAAAAATAKSTDSKPLLLHPQAARAQSTNASVSGQDSTDIETGMNLSTAALQPCLLRSATISAASPGRSSALIGHPLPLYTPYRPTTPTMPTDTRTSTISVGSESQSSSSQARTIDAPDPSMDKNSIHIPVPVSDVTLKADDTNTLTALHQQPSSTVRNIKKHVATSDTTSASTTNTTTSSGIGGSGKVSLGFVGKQLTLVGKQLMPGEKSTASSTPSSCIISNLVIGRRRPMGLRLSPSSRQEPASDSTKIKDPIDLDDYTYIDTDPSDGSYT